MFNQISEYFNFPSRIQCEIRMGYSAQHCAFSMPEKWKSTVDNKKFFVALLTDLSKTSLMTC